MEFNDVGKLQKFIPTKENEQSFDSVICKILQHFAPREIWPDMLGKIAYVTKKKLVIETRAKESRPDEKSWGETQKKAGDGLTEITTLRMKRNLAHNCFLITDQTQIGKGMMRFTAERMPEEEWDETTPLWKYPENTIVNTPLYYPQFAYLFRRIDSIGVGWGKWYKINWLIENFKVWLFAPSYFCILCGKHHQGTHRLSVARELKMPKIKVRIIRHWWVRDTTKPKKLEYYFDDPTSPECPALLKPYEKNDERLVVQKQFIKPSEIYQEYLRLPASERGFRRKTIRSIISNEKK